MFRSVPFISQGALMLGVLVFMFRSVPFISQGALMLGVLVF
jgi:hypothetical protein